MFSNTKNLNFLLIVKKNFFKFNNNKKEGWKNLLIYFFYA